MSSLKMERIKQLATLLYERSQIHALCFEVFTQGDRQSIKATLYGKLQ